MSPLPIETPNLDFRLQPRIWLIWSWNCFKIDFTGEKLWKNVFFLFCRSWKLERATKAHEVLDGFSLPIFKLRLQGTRWCTYCADTSFLFFCSTAIRFVSVVDSYSTSKHWYHLKRSHQNAQKPWDFDRAVKGGHFCLQLKRSDFIPKLTSVASR